jgi:hypothetical protein
MGDLTFSSRLGAPLLLSVLAAVACGGSGNGSGFDTSGGSSSSGGSSGGGSTSSSGGNSSSGGPILSGDGGSGGGDGGNEGCPESATLVYVTGEGDKLYSFYPPTTTFTLIGTFNCLTSPTHMTVDRQGNAWVVANGQLYKASTKDASCTSVSTWSITNDITFPDFALTFIGVSNAVDNTLYLLNDSSGLATFDIASGKLTNVGNANLGSTPGDMTSNGDGTLYFLQDVNSPTLFELSPTNGSTMNQAPVTAKGGGSQALAFWGGSFYAFENSSIYQYDPGKKTTAPLGAAPLNVTGAGQSTCVPKVPPPTR